ncbi:pullulanase [Aerococcaceae bacterium NML191292]|nr:pullulanase [Aerococcaceae bacterium NML191292]
MVSKRNPQLLAQRHAQKVRTYAIRRLKVGVASIAIATGLLFSSQTLLQTVSAKNNEELSTTQLTEETPVPPSDNATDEMSEAGSEEPPAESAVIHHSPTEAIDVDAAPAIEASNFRIHFQNIPNQPMEELSVWLWGGVATPSEQVAGWPHGATRLANGTKTSYGYYIDVPQSAQPANINYLLLKGDHKVTPSDQTIRLTSDQMNEAFIDTNFNVHEYRPLENENTIRINYYREDNNYDNWGLWIWEGIDSKPTNWPTDAIDFVKTGTHGRYIDVPLNNGLASDIAFLIVNKVTKQQTADIRFNDRENHSQIFVRELEAKAYNNPYFATREDAPLVEGTENVTVTATVNKPFHYNEHGVLSVNITKPAHISIQRITADATAIGGGMLDISPELNAITLNATHNIAPGNYQIPIKVIDTAGAYYSTTATATIAPRNKKTDEIDWDEEIIYFMVTDRFKDGDSTNNNPKGLPYDTAINQRGVYRGGDFKGITQKLDYLHSLGITTIWVTPIVQNIDFATIKQGTNEEYYGYHGYWAANFSELNPHLGTLQDFKDLIDAAADKNIKIMVDVVLNHAGYGLKQDDNVTAQGAPSQADRDRFNGMFRGEADTIRNDDIKDSLAGLPDFKTEDPAVRNKLVEWQTAWLDMAKTEKGNSIYGYRVDTVKHVDNTTWQHFKNELAKKDADFHLIGESWDAKYQDTKGHLGNGMMDSLLDFGFKDIARELTAGRLEQANQHMIERNKKLTSAHTLGQFLSSHDEDGFLYKTLGGDKDKFKLAVTMQLTSKGQPVVYYGEEIGQSGANNWPVYGNRYDFAWDDVENNPMLAHYQKLLRFRQNHSELLSRGTNETFAGSNAQQWLMAKRTHDNREAYIAYNIAQKNNRISIKLSDNTATLTDHYSGKTFKPVVNEAGEAIVELDIPSLADGGTLLLTVDKGQLVRAESQAIEVPPIPDGHFRLHFKKLPSDNLNELGLWLWEDVEQPSSNWPNGAINFGTAKESNYGMYIDFKVIDGFRDKIGFLINNTQGSNLSNDLAVDVLSQEMNEAWVDENYKVYSYQPLAEKRTLRINYTSQNGDYENLGIWAWDALKTPFPDNTWPDGFNLINKGKYGHYVDIELREGAESIGLHVVNEQDRSKKTIDLRFSDLANHTQIFIRENDENVYTNPYFVNDIRLQSARQSATDRIEAQFTKLEGMSKEQLKARLRVINKDGETVPVTDIDLDVTNKKMTIHGNFALTGANYTVRYDENQFEAILGWELKDELYGYDGDLGLTMNEDGSQANLKLWSPSADKVNVILYDKENQDTIIGKVAMTRSEKGVWNIDLTSANAHGITDFRGYFYHFEIERDGKKVLTLDPYAKSMAAWNSDIKEEGVKRVGKAAFVNPKQLGPELDFANIEGFKKREDAIIYEAHVRDFTSDPNIASELTHQFGTFAAFVERLDYLQKLGVTHIQLLPVMNYYHANELKNKERHTEYASKDSNYNWGYDPQSYFALSGMYSQDPTNPAKRIEEFKHLVNEIHKRGMGVILDVVYNHTAQTHIFEDLEPNYYHFMNTDGTSRESFGGGRLGTTHKMSRRILVDSIKYLVNEYKVDGFRFDMMGDHDAEAIQQAYDEAAKLNPKIIMLGEGWKTFHGDEGDSRQAADQSWMNQTNSVGVFSDEMRNELKSGYGSEGHPRFLTGGARDIYMIYDNIIAKPRNFTADAPGDVIQYIAAHDNLTLYDVIAQSIKKDPSKHDAEIHRRVRLGNLLILTSQGTPFIHSGQEYGRTKQFIHPDFMGKVDKENEPYKSTYMTDEQGNPFKHPYFIHDSYDSSDAINRFDWQKVTDSEKYPNNTQTQAYTQGLIHLRRSTDAFSRGTVEEIRNNVSLITTPNDEVRLHDLVIGYQAIASNGDIYAVFINADNQARTITFSDKYKHLSKAQVIVDGTQAGTVAIENPTGVQLTESGIQLDPLTASVLLIKKTIPATTITPIPTVTVQPLTVRQNDSITYEDALSLPQGASLTIEKGIDTQVPGEQTAQVRVRFADGSSRLVNIPVTVKEVRQATPIVAVPTAPTVTPLSVNQNNEVDYTSAMALPAGATIQVVNPVDTTIPGKQTAQVRVRFADGSSRLVNIPVTVKEIRQATPIVAVPTAPTVTPLSVNQNNEVDYTSAMTLPAGATIQVVNPVDTTIPGKQTAQVRVRFADGSSRLVSVPVTIMEATQPNTPQEQPDYELTHSSTQVTIAFSGKEPTKVHDLKVDIIQPTTDAQMTALKEKDAVLFDIEALDEHGNDIDIAHPATVRIPISIGKQVEEVLFIPENAPVQSLAFTMIDGNILEFMAQHFSDYAVIFVSSDQEETPKPDGTPPAKDDTASDNQPSEPNSNNHQTTPDTVEPSKPDSTTQSEPTPNTKHTDKVASDNNTTDNKKQATDSANDHAEQMDSVTLPATGEADTLFSVAALSILAGLGLVAAYKPEETE